jgi:hypothetical protein
MCLLNPPFSCHICHRHTSSLATIRLTMDFDNSGYRDTSSSVESIGTQAETLCQLVGAANNQKERLGVCSITTAVVTMSLSSIRVRKRESNTQGALPTRTLILPQGLSSPMAFFPHGILPPGSSSPRALYPPGLSL